MRTAILSVSFVLLLTAWGFALEPESRSAKPIPERLQQVRRMYEKLPCEIVQISEPVEITEVHAYRDGGTIGVILTDAKKARHAFCLDRRTLDERQAREPKHLYLGAAHPTEKGARRMQIRGPEEAAIYGIMLRWVQKHPKRDDLLDPQEKPEYRRDVNFWGIHQFFHRLEGRFMELPSEG